MKIATFNINGIKARIQSLTNWLKQAQPDVVPVSYTHLTLPTSDLV